MFKMRNLKRCVLFVHILIKSLTALDLQRAGLGVQREAAEVHVAHGSDSDSAGEKQEGQQKKHCNQTSRET